MSPKRIQRRRTPGWRLPEGAVYVGRPSKWASPFKLRTPFGLARVPAVEHPGRDWEYEDRVSAAGMRHDFVGSESRTVCHIRYLTPAESVECYRAWVTGGGWPLHGLHHRSPSLEAIWAELAGRDLACWCRLDRPCHADVLLELANPGLPTGGERA